MSRSRLREITGRYDYSKVSKNLEGLEEEENDLELDASAVYHPVLDVRDHSMLEDEDSSNSDEDVVSVKDLSDDPFEQDLEESEASALAPREVDTYIKLPQPPSYSSLKSQEEFEELILQSVNSALSQVGYHIDPESIDRQQGELIIGLNEIDPGPYSPSHEGESGDLSSNLSNKGEKDEYSWVSAEMMDIITNGLVFSRKNGRGTIEVTSDTPGMNRELVYEAFKNTKDRQLAIDYILQELGLISMIKRLCQYP
ncbi:phosphoprotein [Barur virus]|uniref:Phosphoprotein n=1 Tax=Barur virus TaxID=380438 RepID=A0A0D3R1E9_9RHAB|nr:phosphoprotein [Barur virus]AJR28280.1 phosphoprotein [Barur virus]